MAERLPAGMRNNNPGNIKYVGQSDAVGPSVNTDQGDPQAVYASPEAGMGAMYRLLLRKYGIGKITPNQIIAEKGGWTPGNFGAAANVAKSAGIGPNDDIRLTDPTMARKFMRGLVLQEHGPASNAYSDQMFDAAIKSTPVNVNKFTQPNAQSVATLPSPQAGGGSLLMSPTVQPDQGASPGLDIFGSSRRDMSQGDWLRDTNYSSDALIADFFGGRNPLKRMVFQKAASIFDDSPMAMKLMGMLL